MDPAWLQLLQRHESPLLSKSQYSFIQRVFSNIKHLSQIALKNSEARVAELKQDDIKMQATFEKLVRLLHTSFSSSQRFKERFPEWQRYRRTNVQHLRNIAKAIDDDKEKCAQVKVTGSVASLVGGILNLTFGSGGERISQMVGSAMMGIGNLTTVGTSIFEEKWLQENIDEAREIMNRDEECMKSLIAWLIDASCLQRAVDEIQSIHRDKSLITAAKKLQEVSNMNLGERETEEEIQKALKPLNISSNLKEEMGNVLGMLVALFMFLARFRHVFKIVGKAYEIRARLRLCVNIFRAAYGGANSFDILNNRGELTESQKNGIKLGMALDAAEILLFAIRNRDSVEGREIRNVAGRLEREAEELRYLYEDIRALDDPE